MTSPPARSVDEELSSCVSPASSQSDGSVPSLSTSEGTVDSGDGVGGTGSIDGGGDGIDEAGDGWLGGDVELSVPPGDSTALLDTLLDTLGLSNQVSSEADAFVATILEQESNTIPHDVALGGDGGVAKEEESVSRHSSAPRSSLAKKILAENDALRLNHTTRAELGRIDHDAFVDPSNSPSMLDTWSVPKSDSHSSGDIDLSKLLS